MGTEHKSTASIHKKVRSLSPRKKVENPKHVINYTMLLVLCCIVVATGLLYWSSLKAEFLDFDDKENVVNNVLIQHLSFKNLVQYFSTVQLYMYSPLTFISYAIDNKIHGLNPFYFKLTNLILHLANVIFVFIFSFQILKKRWMAILTTLLFAFHPMNVDSVSWISARSNLLCTLFFLLSLILYFGYLQKKNYVYLILSIVSCVLSLLSKSAAVMLPFVLLLMDYFQKRKINYKVILEKTPYLIFCIAIGLIAIFFRTDTGNTQSITTYNFFDRFLMICYSLVNYFIKAIAPLHLSEIYAYPAKTGEYLPIIYYFAPLAIIAIMFIVFRSKKLKREIIFGLSFFVITIIITQLALIEDSYMANRYAYLPYIGLYLIIAFACELLIIRYPKIKAYLIAILLILFSVYSVQTFQRSLVWKNTLSLFNHAIEQSPEAAFAYNSRGIAKFSENDFEGALKDYNQAIKFNPQYAGAYYNRGIVYNTIQDYKNAISDYTKAIELNPGFASSYSARGILEMDILKNDSLAMIDYNKALQINPSFAQVYYNRGILKLRMNDQTTACDDFWMVKKLGYTQADALIEHYCK